MKFLCSNCKAKYQIPDEKIAGRTLKMDCRRCNTPITIRGDQPEVEELEGDSVEEEPRRAPIAASASTRARTNTGASRPAGSSSSASIAAAAARAPARSALGADFRRNVGATGGLGVAPEAPRVTPLDQWHVAINDVPVGPMKRDEISRKIAAGAATADSLAWREGFDDWRPIREIPELAALLRRATEDSRTSVPRAPAPRGSTSRPGSAPAPSGRSPLGTPAPARGAAAARNNVVPIGGRHGASAAPSYEPDDDGDEPENNEATTVASAADLGLLDFGRPARDDGAVPAAKPAAKKDDKPAPKGPTGGFKAIPPPGARPLASPPRAAAPIAPVAARKSTPAPAAFDEPEPEPKRASFAPPPPAVEPIAAPIAVAPIAPVATPAPRDDRRGGLGVFALMGIAGAMAAGAVLMYALVQRFVLAPAPPPTTAIVATIATLAPASGVEPQHVASIDIAPPPSSGVATIATPPPTAAPPPTGTVTGPHHGATPPPTSGARASTKAAAAEDSRFSQFADDGAGPAPIATGPSHSADDPTAGRHSSAELTADQIREVVHTGQRALTTCWETALRQAGHVEGDVRYDVDVTIGMTGRVTSARARGPAMGALQECLERGVRRWGFPPSATETSTSFPLLFSAQQ